MQSRAPDSTAGKQTRQYTLEIGCDILAAAPILSMWCLQVVQQRRKLPPVINDKALFTKAATYGDRADQAYHAPSNRIGVHYSPASMAAAGMLFEEFPQVGSS